MVADRGRHQPRTPVRKPPASLWQSIAFWRSFAIGAATLAAASIAALAYIGLVPASRPPLMATLAGSSGQPNFVAAVTATGNNLVVVPAALLTNDPRAMELWLILPGPNQRPHSLGLIQPGQPIRLTIPPDLAASSRRTRRSRCRSSRPAARRPASRPDRSSPAAS
jgi:anti-sigma-K factor RskA